MNAILWLLRTGCQWRNMPVNYPHWQTVYYCFDRWKGDGTLERINRELNLMDRRRQGREDYPWVFCIDSQSVKLAPVIGRYRGLDPHQKVNGRKRQFLVDTGGRLWAADVHLANQADGPASLPLVSTILWYGDRIEKVFGDRAYGGVFARELSKWGVDFEQASRPESGQGFLPVAKRWVVERSIAWTNYLPKNRQGLRAHSIFFRWLANFGQHSDYVAANRDGKPNLISKHALSSFTRWVFLQLIYNQSFIKILG